ncbi:hypothetical protein ACS0TY_021303 [Phlomoides rotata]
MHSDPRFKEFVGEKWRSYNISGWGGFILKEKFKKLKAGMKTWNQDIFGSLDNRIEERRKRRKNNKISGIMLGEEWLEEAAERFLVLLELVSGLKINMGKSSIYGRNVDDQHLSSYANILGCNVGAFPFKYLDVMIGSSHRKISDWEYVV